MDVRVAVNSETESIDTTDAFLLDEGLELLASYRSIGSEAVRRAVREFVAALSTADDGVSSS